MKRLVATGGLPHHNPLLMQIYADVLGRPIHVHPSKQGPALGAAISGVLAAGKKLTGFKSAEAAISSMAKIADGKWRRLSPIPATHWQYESHYQNYRTGWGSRSCVRQKVSASSWQRAGALIRAMSCQKEED